MDPSEGDRWRRLAKLCDLDARLAKLPEGVAPRASRSRTEPRSPEAKEAARRERARTDKRARRERVEAMRKLRDQQAASRGRLRGKQRGKPLDASMRPGKGVRG